MGSRNQIAAVIVLMAAAVVFHHSVLFQSEVTFPWDFRTHHFALAVGYADSLREGHLPLWDPYTYCGRPLLANPQTATFYPGMFAAVLPGRPGLLKRMEWLEALHVALAGVFTFFLALRLGLTVGPALFAGLAFELGGFFASQAEHLSAVLGGAWLAGAWLATSRQRWRIPFLAFSWTMSFFVGFTAFTLMTVVSTILFAVWMVWDRQMLRDLICAGILSLLMSAVQLGPALELANQSVGKYRTDWMQWGGGVPWRALASLVVPNLFGVFDIEHFHAGFDPTLLYEYSGVVTLLFAAYAIRRRRLRMLGLLLTCLLLMTGEYSPVARVLYAAAPKFVENTIYWYVFLCPFLLSLALLAAQGLQYLKRVQLLACAAVFLELFLVSSNRPLVTQSLRLEPLPQVDELVRRVKDLAGDLRVDTANDSLELMTAAPILRWRAANGYDPLALERLIQVRLNAAPGARWGAYYQIQQPDSPALDWMSVRVLLSRTQLKTKKLLLTGNIKGHWIYVNPLAPARYRAANCTLEHIAESRNRIELDANCAAASTLETSEPYYSAWQAGIDGRDAPILVVNQGFRGLALTPGRHHITLAYSRRLLGVCAAISVMAWIVWCGLLKQNR